MKISNSSMMIFLQITGSETRSSSDQYIVSRISVDIAITKLWLNGCILINRRRIWWLYYVVSFGYKDGDLVPIRMNVMFFLVGLLSITILVLDIICLTLLNSYWLRNIIHLFFSTENDVFPLTFIWRIRPYFLILD